MNIRPGLRPGLRNALRDYSQGPVALIPALVLLLTIREFGAAGGWGSRQVLALSLGMTVSVLTTTGFVQGVNRRAAICLGLGDKPSATRFLRNALGGAGICVAGFGCLLAAGAGRVGLFTGDEVLTFLLAFLGLSVIWLLSAGLSLMRASFWFGIALAAGLTVGVSVDRALAGWPDVHLGVAAVCGFLSTIAVLAWSTRRALRPAPAGPRRRVALPSAAYLISEATPYFLHGALYALLYFIPHIFGWLGALAASDTPVWSLASFEAGMTLAMPPLILAGGVAEHTLQQFWLRAQVVQATTPANRAREFETALTAFYWQQLFKYLVVLSGLTICASLLFRWAVDAGLAAAWLGLDRLDLVETVFDVGLLTYLLLGWGLFNGMFALSLARPQFAIRGVLSGVAGAIVVGAAVNLLGGTDYALLSALVGTAVYVVASTWTTTRLFDGMHYYYVTAF